MTSRPVISRRTMLLGGAAIVPTVLAVRGLPRAAVAAPDPVPDAAPGFFTADEMAFLRAFVDRLIPADEVGPGALEAGVPEFVDRQMNTSWAHGGRWYLRGPFVQAAPEFGYQLPYTPRELYRRGIAAARDAIARRFGREFAALDAATRDQAIGEMESGALAMADVPSKLFFGQVLNNTREGYFSDPIHGGNRGMAAWKMIGFPGARGDYTDWVNQQGARYPFGPVSISDLPPVAERG